MATAEPLLYEQFDNLEQQHYSSNLGMWAFLSTEVLFFGGLFTAFILYNSLYPEAFERAAGHLDVWLGAFNTAVLLCSSLTVALGVRSAQLKEKRKTLYFLLGTLVLGSIFLGIKFYEWSEEYHEGLVPGLTLIITSTTDELTRQEAIFWCLYFAMTGLHALHMIIGAGILVVLIVLLWRDWLTGCGATQIDMFGLYWHFVDIVWVFLYPLLYLINW